MKRILFLSGTRAEYGKMKTLMASVAKDPDFDLHIFVTGMHTLSKYGTTWLEIKKDGFENIYLYMNQKQDSHMDTALSNTITGLSNYVYEIKPDLIVIHGDRLEALAGAIVGAFNNIRVAHIEGGEVSGTIDESIRHAVSKFSHFHFVANEEAKKRVIQLGEPSEKIYVIGSPDIDVMYSDSLPALDEVKEYYGIPFENYSILMYHPVTTNLEQLQKYAEEVVCAVLESGRNFVVIYPNNDEGNLMILNAYKQFERKESIRLFPSVRFESFLTLLKNSECMLGNSSAGIREAGLYDRPTIDLGNRQSGRYNKNKSTHIRHCNETKEAILGQLGSLDTCCSQYSSPDDFGSGDSASRFMEIISRPSFWSSCVQKQFVDVEF